MKQPHVYEISRVVDALAQDALLFVPENFTERVKALDFLELHGLDSGLKLRLDNANEKLFAQLLASIRARDHATFRDYFRNVAKKGATPPEETLGYDELDMLVAGLLDVAMVPEAAQIPDPDMVFYQPTPARIVLNLIDELDMSHDDVFYDLGSGLGHVPILVNLLTGNKAKGVELEEAYCRYAAECVKKLALHNVEFIHEDARHAAYDDGTIFYLYTPFQGEILRQVLQQLEAQAARRPIKVCTYGACTATVSRERWLESIYQTGEGESSVAIFRSI